MVNTTTLRAYLDDIHSLLKSGATIKVISHCRYVLQHYPQNVEAYRLLAQALLDRAERDNSLDYFDEAVAVFQRVLSVLPNDMIAHRDVGRIRKHQGQLDRAVWHMERAYEQQPGDRSLQEALRMLYSERSGSAAPPKLQLSRGALIRQYINAQLYDQALIELRDALNKLPDRVDLQVLLAETLWETRHTIEAGEAAVAILNKLPYCLSANRVMARLWLDNERPTDAQVFLNRIEAVDPYAARRVINPDVSLPDTNTIVRLDYDAESQSAMSSETPDWVADLNELETSDKATMWAPGSEITFDAADSSQVSPFVDMEADWLDDDVDLGAAMAPDTSGQAASEESFSDWLKEIEDGPTHDDVQEPEASEDIALAADWFADLPEKGAYEAGGQPPDLTPNIDFDDWSADATPGDDEAALASSLDDDPAVPGEVPDWLGQPIESLDEDEGPTDAMMPDVSVESEPAADEPAPDWFAQEEGEGEEFKPRTDETRPLPSNWVPDSQPSPVQQPDVDDEAFDDWLTDDSFATLDSGEAPAEFAPGVTDSDEIGAEQGELASQELEAAVDGEEGAQEKLSDFTDLLENIDRSADTQSAVRDDILDAEADELAAPAWLTPIEEEESAQDQGELSAAEMAGVESPAEMDFDSQTDAGAGESDPGEDTPPGIEEDVEVAASEDDTEAWMFMANEVNEAPHEDPGPDAEHETFDHEASAEGPIRKSSPDNADDALNWMMDPEYDFFTPTEPEASESPLSEEGEATAEPEAASLPHDAADTGDWMNALDEADESALEELPIESEPMAEDADQDDPDTPSLTPEQLPDAGEETLAKPSDDAAPDDDMAEQAASEEQSSQIPDWLAQAAPSDADDASEVEADADDLLAMFDAPPEDVTPAAWDEDPTLDLGVESADSETDMGWLSESGDDDGDWLGAFSAVGSTEDVPEDESESVDDTFLSSDAAEQQDDASSPEPSRSEFDDITDTDAMASDTAELVGDAEDAQTDESIEIAQSGDFIANLGIEPAEKAEPASEDDAVDTEDKQAPVFGERSVLGSLTTEDDSPAWLVGLEVAEPDDETGELNDVLSEPYDPFAEGDADQVPTYEAATETGVLQPDEQPPWMTAFTGEELPPEEADEEIETTATPASGAEWTGEGDETDVQADDKYAAAETAQADEVSALSEVDDAIAGFEDDDIELDEGGMPSWLLEIAQSEAGKLDPSLAEEDEVQAQESVGDAVNLDGLFDEMEPSDAEAYTPASPATEPDEEDLAFAALFEAAEDEPEADVSEETFEALPTAGETAAEPDEEDMAFAALFEDVEEGLDAKQPGEASERDENEFDFDAFLAETGETEETTTSREPEGSHPADETGEATLDDLAVDATDETALEVDAQTLEDEKGQQLEFEVEASEPIEFAFEEPDVSVLDVDDAELDDLAQEAAEEVVDNAELQARDEVAEQGDMPHTKVDESETEPEDGDETEAATLGADDFAFDDVVPAWLRRPKENAPSEDIAAEDTDQPAPEWLRDVFEDDDLADTDADDSELD